MAFIEANNLVVEWSNKTLFNNLSFFIQSPGLYVIVGNNGSGKSTLGRCIMGNVPYKGTLLTEGKKAFLAQKNNVLFPITAFDLALMGRLADKGVFGTYTLSDKKDCESIFEKLNIERLKNRLYSELSGGEQQLVQIAKLMLQNADIYILDEPTQNLDIYNKEFIHRTIMKQLVEQQKTVLYITHDLHLHTHDEGYIINLSEKNPAFEKLHHQKINQVFEFLKENTRV